MNKNEDEIHADDAIIPLARRKEVVIQQTGNETLIYDLKIDKAHRLNETMSLIWNHCDGESSYGLLLDALKQHTKDDIGIDFVTYALKELEKKNLLEIPTENLAFDLVSRRRVIMKYTAAAVAIPIVLSIMAPPASAQASACLPFASPCPGAAPCCPGLSCIDPGGGRPLACT